MNLRTETIETMGKPKPWYARRRYGVIVLFASLVYFCLIPSPLRISPETTGITASLLPCGNVDYFGAFEKTYIHRLSPPEDNGLRLIIAALGPRGLEQTAIADSVPWEEMPTHEWSRRWFHEQWIPLCEHMGIDPYAKPHFLDNPDFHRFLRQEWEANREEGDAARVDPSAVERLRRQLSAAPWRAEEHPNIARWLEERTPVLDLFGVAVRKPNFACYRQQPGGGSLVAVVLPDVQSMRQFARELAIRVTERLGRGDVDGAWHDVMSMLYLSRNHYIHDPILVVNLVGIAVEGQGWEAAGLILQYGNPTAEQLEQFAQDIDSLPRRATMYSELERLFTYSVLQDVYNRDEQTLLTFFGGDECCGRSTTTWDGTMLRYITLLPIDRNIAGRRITEFLQSADHLYDDSAQDIDRTERKRRTEELENMQAERIRQVESFWSVLRVPLIRTRSQLIADQVIAKAFYSFQPAQNALDRVNARLELSRLAIALERYKAANGDYPVTLDELVPAFLAEVPLDPFTGRKTLTYILAPDEETAFLLYSYGKNETDDGGDEGEDIVLRMIRR